MICSPSTFCLAASTNFYDPKLIIMSDSFEMRHIENGKRIHHMELYRKVAEMLDLFINKVQMICNETMHTQVGHIFSQKNVSNSNFSQFETWFMSNV